MTRGGRLLLEALLVLHVLQVVHVPDVIEVAEMIHVMNVRDVGGVQVLHMRDVGQVSGMRLAQRDADDGHGGCGGHGEQATVLERFHDARGGSGGRDATPRFRFRMSGKHIDLIKTSRRSNV